MSWKTTDSAKRSGIGDFIRAPIALNSENITGVESELSVLTVQNLVGNYDDGTFGNTINILADSLAYSDINNVADPLRFYSTVKDSNGKNVIMIGRTRSGAPDVNSSIVFDDKQNILFFADDISYATFNNVAVGNARFLVNAPSVFTSDVIIDGSLDVQGDLYFHTEHEVSGNAYFSGEVIVRNKVGIGGNNGLSRTDTTMTNPVWPSPDAKLDIRSFTSIGRTGQDLIAGQTDWKAANIYLDCGNLAEGKTQSEIPPSGIEWRPLAIDHNSDNSGPDICYNRLSAAIRFMPEDDYFRGGLGFYTSNDKVHNNQDPETNGLYDVSLLRMKIDMSGNTTFYENTAINGNATISGNTSINGNATIGGNIIINQDKTIATTSWNTQSNQDPTPAKRAMELINNNMLSNTGRNIGLGYKTSTKNQSELWFHYIGDNNNNNYGSLGLFGYPNTLAFGTNGTRGNVAIGYDISNNWYDQFSTTTLSVNGNTYINGALEIDKNNVSSILRTSKALDVPGERSVDLLYDFTANTRKCIALGDDTSARRQSEFWYYHHDDSDTYNNFGYIGLFGHASTIAFGATDDTASSGSGNSGNVAIGYPESDMHNGQWKNNFNDYTLSVKGRTKLEGNIDAPGQQISCEFINTAAKVGIGQNYDPLNMLTVAGNDGNPSLSVNNNIVAINASAKYNTTTGTTQQNYNLYVSGSTNLGGPVNIEGNVTMGVLGDAQTFTLNGKELTHHDNEGYAKLDSSPTFTGIVTAPSFNATSDKTKKEDIKTISDATEKLTSLRGVSFKLKDDEEKKTHYGVVAQEIEKVFPDMVHGEEGNKSVAYMEIIGVLIETVKDLKKRIEELENK